MRKFTKGNWKIDMSSMVSYECRHTFIYPEDLEVKQIDEDVHIALVNENYEECAANARLIAAAPEMYELLKVWTQMRTQPTLMIARKKAEELLASIDGDSDVKTQESEP